MASHISSVPSEDAYAVAGVLYSEEAIARRVTELGAELAAYYRDLQPVVLPVMSGAMFFAADLTRAMRPRPRGMTVETMKAKSYEGTSSSGKVTLEGNGRGVVDVDGKHVLLVEDIVDTGRTMRALAERFSQAGAVSVKFVALLDKRAGRDVKAPRPEWSGFVMEKNEFVVGYGLDFDGCFRELRYVGVLKKEAYANESVGV
jgi:hypoxanthine phosphoribosyltransferase